MRRYTQFAQRFVKFLFAPLTEFVRLWEKDDFGKRLIVVLIEVVLIFHMLMLIFPKNLA